MRTTISVKVTGHRQVKQAYARLGKRATVVGAAAVRESAERVLVASLIECPIETGDLRESGHVTGPYVRGGVLADATVIYGGQKAPHAFIVHEDLEAHHDAPTKAKYLEDPFNRYKPLFPAHIARRMRSDRVIGRVLA